MELQSETRGDVTLVTVLTDFLDVGNSPDFKEQMSVLLPGVRHLLLDLSHVQFINSAGLASLLSCLKQLSRMGGDMKICAITSPVRALFELVKLQRIIEVCKTREEGLQAFARDAAKTGNQTRPEGS